MTQPDGAWPSEDEDFDAVIDPGTVNKDIQEPKNESKQQITPRSKVAAAKPIQINDASETQGEPSDNQQADDPTWTESEQEGGQDEQPEEVITGQASLESAPDLVETSTPAEPEVPQEQPVEPVAAAAAAPTAKQPARKFGKLSTIHYVIEAILIIVIGVLAYTNMQLSNDKTDLNNQVTKLNSDPQIVIKKQTDDIIKRVGALMTLPTGETPTIANVSDATKAKQQSAFFKDAENGDKVLMYVKAQQAILYRPSTDKIVLVAPLTFSNDQAASTTTSTTKTKQ